MNNINSKIIPPTNGEYIEAIGELVPRGIFPIQKCSNCKWPKLFNHKCDKCGWHEKKKE